MRIMVKRGDAPYIKQHVKNRRGQRVGLLLAFKDPLDEGFRVGYSKCNVSREPFNATRAFDMALGRACTAVYQREEKLAWPPIDENFPQSMEKDFEQFIDRCRRYFKTQRYYTN
jgi:hypothetical protein